MTMTICRGCGCTTAQAAADALVLGFRTEFQTGKYSCCQVVAWADEQWIAWADAASEDGKSEEEVTKPLQVAALSNPFPGELRTQRNAD